jgi:hypothetical protein
LGSDFPVAPGDNSESALGAFKVSTCVYFLDFLNFVRRPSCRDRGCAFFKFGKFLHDEADSAFKRFEFPLQSFLHRLDGRDFPAARPKGGRWLIKFHWRDSIFAAAQECASFLLIPTAERIDPSVMDGLVPPIHVFFANRGFRVDGRRDGRAKRRRPSTAMAGHDGESMIAASGVRRPHSATDETAVLGGPLKARFSAMPPT